MKKITAIFLCWYLSTAAGCSVDRYTTHVTLFYEQQLWTNAKQPAIADAKTRLEYGIEWTGKPDAPLFGNPSPLSTGAAPRPSR